MKRGLLSVFAVFSLLILDQLAKSLFAVSFNHGAVFGILQQQTVLLVIASILLISVLIFLIISNQRNSGVLLSLLLLLSGALGNLLDRLRFGYVRDFISLSFWPSFNLADVFLTSGCLLLLFFLARKEKKKQKKK
jgi:signal peptidase II